MHTAYTSVAERSARAVAGRGVGGHGHTARADKRLGGTHEGVAGGRITGGARQQRAKPLTLAAFLGYFVAAGIESAVIVIVAVRSLQRMQRGEEEFYSAILRELPERAAHGSCESKRVMGSVEIADSSSSAVERDGDSGIAITMVQLSMTY